MKVVVIKDMSAGNESVGEMWQETKIFEHTQPIGDILRWVNDHNGKSNCFLSHSIPKKRVTITVPDGENMEELIKEMGEIPF